MSIFGQLAPRLQEAIVARLGWSSLRPVQEAAGAALLSGKNAVVLAPTAGGKTEASMFPTISGMVMSPPVGVGTLYIAPIKALLNNQADRLGLYTEMVGLRRFVWHGDVGSHARKKFLRDPAELLMTTPESLEVMLVSQSVDARALFGDLRAIVIDEVHAVAGTDRGAHLMSVLERLAVLSKHDIQRVGLSATVGNPAAILAWLQGSSRRPGAVVDPPKKPGAKNLLIVHRDGVGAIAHDAAQMARGQKSLFFCQSRSTTEAVAEQMRRAGTEVFVHHSAVSKEERALTEERFHHGKDACIVCTSTLELGIDVGDLDRVLQAEAPDTVSSFMQRMGRTGRRAGQAANTTFFCETEEGVLQAIALVELAKAGWVENVPVQARCWPVLLHQLLAMSLGHDGIAPEAAWQHLKKVPDFADIHRAEFDRLVGWMLRDRSLILASGLLILGPQVERRFGRRNFMELYAVFSSPQSYTVLTASGQPLGTLNQAFVDRLVEDTSAFLLGGRGWTVTQIRHDDREVRVVPAPRGRQPTWGGFLPQFLGFDLCQRVLDVLCEDASYPYLHPTAASVLAERRAAFEGVLEPVVGGIEEAEDELRWWTFAGGRINSTLRYALKALNANWKVVPDNYVIKLRGEHVHKAQLAEAIGRLRTVEFWDDEKLWEEVSEDLPNYRLSKFQPLMPPWVEREVLAEYLLDVEGAWRWVNGSEADSAQAPQAYRTALQKAAGTATTPELAPAPRDDGQAFPRPKLPLRWVRTNEELVALCADLRTYEVVALDCETTMATRRLCLAQFATPDFVALIDAQEVGDLSPLESVLASDGITKVIHNAPFERSVFKRHGIAIEGVFDTLVASREARGRDVDGGHTLKAVCERELGVALDKSQQTSDWTVRPLTERQVAYAAMDAEVLLGVWGLWGE